MFDLCSNRFSIRSNGDGDGDDMSREDKEYNHQSERKRSCEELFDKEDEDLANCLVMLSNSGMVETRGKNVNQHGTKPIFECKACKKVFRSHQALGGHRASHKKIKGCSASVGKGIIEDEDEDDEDEEEDDDEEKSTTQMARKRSNIHECTICHRVFASGQALGGHKRCHWLTSTTSNHQPPSFFFDNFDKPVASKCEPSDLPSLDLNLGCPNYFSIDRIDRHEDKDNRFKLREAMKVQMISSSSSSSSNSSSWLQLASGH